MSTNQFRSLLVCVLCLSAAPAQASQLLVEFGWYNTPVIAEPGFYHWGAGAGPYDDPLLANWSTNVLDNTNFVSEAPPDLVANFNAVFTSGYRAGTNMTNSTLGPYECRGGFGCSFDRIVGGPDGDWAGGPYSLFGWYGLAHVANRGPSLTGYMIDRIQRVITPDAQLIYLYGNAVPEPTAVLLILLGGVHLIALSRRQRD